MNRQMADPHIGMVSFQDALRKGSLKLGPVAGHADLFSHFDMPAPGEGRLTFVRLADDRRTVRAFLSCLWNGEVEGCPCMAVGYAVPMDLRNQGLAKRILQDVISEQAAQAGKRGLSAIYVEAVIDAGNIPSQRVAEAVLKVERESLTDEASGRPAYRYTKRVDCQPTEPAERGS